MSWKIDPEIAALAADGARALASFLWDTLTGETHTRDAAKAIDTIKRRALEAAAEAAILELQVFADAAGLRFAAGDLGDSARELVAGIADAERRGAARMDFPAERVELEVVADGEGEG